MTTFTIEGEFPIGGSGGPCVMGAIPVWAGYGFRPGFSRPEKVRFFVAQGFIDTKEIVLRVGKDSRYESLSYAVAMTRPLLR